MRFVKKAVSLLMTVMLLICFIPSKILVRASSTLTLTDATYPIRIMTGSSFTLKGTITSDYTITNVTVSVTDSSDAAVISKSVQPASNTFSISTVDSAFVFGSLPQGAYTYKIKATDTASGEVTLLSKVFNIGSAFDGISNARLRVADVSKWQSTVDWSKVRPEVDAAIIRIGIRYSASRAIDEDTYFSANYTNAKANNVPVGCYFYSTALNTAEAVKEAQWVIAKLQAYGCKMEMPIYFDIEDATQEALTKAENTAIARAFCSTLTQAGYFAGIYCSKSWATTYINLSQLLDYTVWIAQYNTSCTYTGEYNMWQYTDSAAVSGISTSCDMSICYKDFPSYIKTKGLNGFEPVAYEGYGYRTGSYIVADENYLNVRAGAGTSFDVLGTLPKGTQVNVLEVAGKWGRIRFNSQDAWISLWCGYVVTVDSTVTTIGTIGNYITTAPTLNVRSGAGTSYTALGTLANGSEVYIYEISNGWGRIIYNSQNAWISLTYASFNGTVLFNANGGTGIMENQSILNSHAEALSPNAFTRKGYVFSGWSLTSGGDAMYDDCASFTMASSNVILYAVWDEGAADIIKIEGSTSVVNKTDKFICGLETGLSEAELLQSFIASDGDADIEIITGAGKIGTGTLVRTLVGQTVVNSYTVVIFGDIDGNSYADGNDAVIASMLANGLMTQEQVGIWSYRAADANCDGVVDALDGCCLAQAGVFQYDVEQVR